LKILVVSQYFWPENFRINDLVAELSARGHEVTVLTGYPNYPEGAVFKDFRDNPGSFLQYGGADIIRVPMISRGKGSLRLMLNYASFAVGACLVGPFKLRRRSIDKIFVFEPSPITVGIPAILLRAIKRAPLALWVLDLWPESLHAVGAVRSQAILGLVGRLVSFIYRHCDVILAQSKSFVEQIRKHSGAANQIEFFPSWAEDLFAGVPPNPARELDRFKACFKILFAGNIGEAQDFPAIMDAAERLRERRDIQWLFVGDGRMAAWVAAEIQRRDLESTVTMLGRFPLDRMPSFYTGADALLVTLKKSDIFAMTIPGKVQSYLAAGRPLLGMLDGEGAAVIEEAKAGLVCSAGKGGDLAAIAAKLADSSPTLRSEMGDAAMACYLAQFKRSTLMNRMENLLTDLRLHEK
jgi:glycosyltransferase involved in cell wall biosynthesis